MIIRNLLLIGDQLSLRVSIAIIVLLSLAVKFSFVQLFQGGIATLPSESDVYFYNGAAQNLYQYGVYGLAPNRPTYEMPPGESAFLASLYLVSDGSITFARIAHILLATTIPVFTYFTALALFSRSAAFWSGILIAIDPAQNFLAGSFLSDLLFIALMIAAIFILILEHIRSDTWWRPIIAGTLFALAGLTRNQGWPFPILILLASVITEGRTLSIRSSSLVLLTSVMLIAPWTWRNYRLSKSVIPVSAEGGLTFWASNNPEFAWRPPMPMSLPVYDRPEGLNQVEIDRFYRTEAIYWIQNNELQFLRNSIRKFLVLYYFDPMSQQSERALIFLVAGLFPYGILLPFMILGIIKEVRNDDVWLILLYIFYTTILAMLFYGDSRIRAPIQPYLYIFAVNWIIWFTNRVQPTPQKLHPSQSSDVRA